MSQSLTNIKSLYHKRYETRKKSFLKAKKSYHFHENYCIQSGVQHSVFENHKTNDKIYINFICKVLYMQGLLDHKM
jgi:hypothetical protein